MKHPKPSPNTPSLDKLGVLPTRPRFTLADLRKIIIGKGDGDSTIAGYVYTHNGTACEKYADFASLTHAEREAALEFILKFTDQAEITRRGKPRGRSGQPRQRRPPAPLDLSQVEFDPLELTDADFAPPKLDFEPLELTDRPDPEAEKVLPKPKKSRPHRKQ